MVDCFFVLLATSNWIPVPSFRQWFGSMRPNRGDDLVGGIIRCQFIFSASKRDIVRREKAWILSGWDSRPATFIASAGSNRSGGGGDDTVGAFDVKDRLAVPRVGRPQRK